MRRLLHGAHPAAPPPAPTPAPPPLPAPPARPRVKTPPAPPPVLARSAIPVPDEGMEMEVGLPVRPVTLHQAASAHVRAQIHTGIHASVVQRMQDTASRVTGHGPVAGTHRTTRSEGLRDWLHDRGNQRSAIVASIIFGPPRAMEPIR